MNDCGCNTGFVCIEHRLAGRIGKGTSADSDLMAQNDVIDYLPEKIDKELIATMYQIRIEYQAMKERMNYFEAWFANAFDRIGTIEKQICGLQQQMKVWLDGRGGMS